MRGNVAKPSLSHGKGQWTGKTVDSSVNNSDKFGVFVQPDVSSEPESATGTDITLDDRTLHFNPKCNAYGWRHQTGTISTTQKDCTTTSNA